MAKRPRLTTQEVLYAIDDKDSKEDDPLWTVAVTSIET